MEIFLLSFLASLLLASLISPLIIKMATRLKASQTVLEYVQLHKSKSGTPTLGGLIFLFSSLVSICFFTNNYTLALLSLVSMLFYGILGFLDDYIKIKFKQNLGLKAYQKIIGQVGIATLIAFFCYYSGLVGSSVYVPFTNISVDFGWLIIPFIILVFLALTNSVNLTDGLDGLATGTSIAYLLGFISLLIIYRNLQTEIVAMEFSNMIILCTCVVGGLFGFLCFNCFPAKIFMGDTGSLAIGGLFASLAVFSKLELIVPIIGVMFAISSLSVIIQVLHFKRTKKRVFKMAPIHHHFQMCGVHENRITLVYIVITLAVNLFAVLITIFAGAKWI